MRWTRELLVCATAAALLAPRLAAETGHKAWLRYARIDDAAVRARYATLPATVVTFSDSPVIASGRDELIRGVRGMLGRTLRIDASLPKEGAFVLGTIADLTAADAALAPRIKLKPDGYWIATRTAGGQRRLIIAGENDRGVLYGVFAVLRKIGLHQPVIGPDERSEPYAPVRWVNEWDNLNGTIERGYGGRSIFFENDNVREDLGPVRDYARMLASLGVNGCVITNVNSNPRTITTEFVPQLARLAAVFRPWGIRMAVSVDFGSPKSIGGLDTFDPLDPRVVAWWKAKADEIYRAVPDLGGFLLKADSEGRVGPSAYGRTHADAANAIARGLKPHGGLLFYRGFVYDHHMDWRNLKNDRARAAYDNFASLDGQFDDNVIIQIKPGPIDFQVREPSSPLFGALEKTNQVIEMQITQEYFGQAHHLVFLVPYWKYNLDFDMHAKGPGTPVKALVAGRVFHRPEGGFVGVSNVGLDANWMGFVMSQANLYGFGRLAWNPDLSSRQIVDEWTRLTFSNDPMVVKTIGAMQLASWRNYENYTGPLGLQTLTDIVGNHYGPAVEASERNGWGQWHRADAKGVGMDRTVETGTGFIGQYRPAVAAMFESLKTCPDNLLLFMHHVPYTYVLHSGETVIQHIYNAHYAGAEAVAGYAPQWKSLKGRIDDERYAAVLRRLEYQAGAAELWRDAVNTWFLKESGIPDKTGRAGHFPGRFEAEAMQLDGYQAVEVKPWEVASGSKAVACEPPATSCSATMKFEGRPGWYDVRVRYFDKNNGVSRFRLFVNGQLIDTWLADNTLPTRRLDGTSSTRRDIRGVALRAGDAIRVEGTPDGAERAALDYFELRREASPQPVKGAPAAAGVSRQ
jgi:alpha-glucuronidase